MGAPQGPQNLRFAVWMTRGVFKESQILLPMHFHVYIPLAVCSSVAAVDFKVNVMFRANKDVLKGSFCLAGNVSKLRNVNPKRVLENVAM